MLYDFKFSSTLYSFLLLGAICQDTIGTNEEGRIFGGHKVTINDFPYQVSIFSGNEHNCGGSIINENYIITAGHCVEDISNLRIYYSLNNTEEVFNRNEIVLSSKVEKIIRHPKYKITQRGIPINDIAIFKVKPPIKYTSGSMPIKIGNVTPVDGKMLTATGYGRTEENKMSGKLMGVSVPKINTVKCNKIYRRYLISIKQESFCAGYLKGEKDTCQGDSGGPVTSDGILVGIVSWGHGCAERNFVGVYTNVAHYYNWIKNVTST